jgi:hypothetical protein
MVISWIIRNYYRIPQEIVEGGAHLGIRGSAVRNTGQDNVGKLVRDMIEFSQNVFI